MRRLVTLFVALSSVLAPATASAASGSTEQRASARWTFSQCPDGSQASNPQMIVETDNFIPAGTTPSPTPPLRVQYVGVCPDGTYQWGFNRPAPTQYDANNLKSATVANTTFTNVPDNRGVFHTVSVQASWTMTSALMTTVNSPGSITKKRTGTATAKVVFDGQTLVDGAANFPFPRPFMDVDIEK